jgi:hypothetical protein
MPVTFVTSFFHIFTEEFDGRKTTQWRIDRFIELAQSGIPICIYVSRDFQYIIENMGFSNVKVMKTMDICDLWVYKETKKVEYTLPTIRNYQKDIDEYMFTIQSKLEFMKDAVYQNHWKTDYFAWIDFNITHIFHNKQGSLQLLKILSRQNINEKVILFPGCWSNKYTNDDSIKDQICWRFCGGFFVGHRTTILDFHNKYTQYYPQFMRTYQKLVWEVNFWAWIETNTDLPMEWYYADHNDQMFFNIPSRFFVNNLNRTCEDIEKYAYFYPVIEHYNPSSACYLCYNGEHLLNTRYINYYYYDEGASYIFYDGSNIIRTKHMFSKLTLDENTKALCPFYFNEFHENIELPKHELYARGIEDIRLFSVNQKVRFIGTSVEYYHTSGNRMIVGDYDIEQGILTNGTLIESPYNEVCEKNWIPLVDENQREWFIYRWSPFEVGYLEDTGEHLKKKLIINRTFIETCGLPFFDRVRGSSTFVEDPVDKTLIGVVHYCDGDRKRQYFHMLVSLDKTTFRPLKYSDPFVFQNIGIEFCIGFTIMNGKYCFWISQMDREPILFSVSQQKINIINKL